MIDDGAPSYVKTERNGKDDDDGSWRSEIVVRRLGDGRFPVEVLLVFADDTEVRHTWDGNDRWTLIVEERESKLKHALVDPDRVLMLDVNYTNNGRLLEPAPALAARKWSSKWMVWLQDMLSTFAFFI